MSFFSEMGAGLRAVVKEYNEIKQEVISIKDDVSGGVKSVADETAQLADAAKNAVSSSATTLDQVAKDAKTNLTGAVETPNE